MSKKRHRMSLESMSMSARRRICKEWTMAYAFLAPALVLLIAFLVYPTYRTIILSFQEWNGLGDAEFIGLKNFREMFKARSFWTAVKHTFDYCFCETILSVLVGMCLALAIERRVKGWQFYKFVFYISVMLSVTVVSILFIQIMEPNYGVFNKMLDAVGLENISGTWLANPKRAMGTVIAVSTWQFSGFTMLLFLASMEGINPGIHEAATIDGVTEFKRIFYITLPMIKRTILVVVMFQFIFSLTSFDKFWVMTAGGPGDATETLTTLLYRNATKFANYGYASAVSVFLLAVVSVISIFYLRMTYLGDQVNE